MGAFIIVSVLSGFPRAGKPTINDSVVVVKALSTKHSWYVVTSALQVHAQGQLQRLSQTRSADATIAVAAASTATGVGFMQVAEE